MSTFETEVAKGERFSFGKNWKSFLSVLTDERIGAAERSLIEMLKLDNLQGRTVLDIGSGSGLFSLAARRLGADVFSFDYDPESVACVKALRSCYFPEDSAWHIVRGSVLDKAFVGTLGRFDVVYSWGVLHHTGDMWTALENTASLVRDGGVLFIAIYNDQGSRSLFWRRVKSYYCSSWVGKAAVSCVFLPYFSLRTMFSSILQRNNKFSEYRRNRGMSITHDWRDWLGGYPFEVASIEKVFHFFHDRGFVLRNIATTNGFGNNQYVFTKAAK